MYSAIIDSMCKGKLVNDAFDLYSEMIAKNISPDVVTYSTLISAKATLAVKRRLACEMLKRWQQV
jgi:pentatricopeptide repeat protein